MSTLYEFSFCKIIEFLTEILRSKEKQLKNILSVNEAETGSHSEVFAFYVVIRQMIKLSFIADVVSTWWNNDSISYDVEFCRSRCGSQMVLTCVTWLITLISPLVKTCDGQEESQEESHMPSPQIEKELALYSTVMTKCTSCDQVELGF